MSRASLCLWACCALSFPVVLQAAEHVYPTAILPFAERGADVRDMGRQLTDLLFVNLVTDPRICLVDRDDMETVLKELEVNLSGLVDSKSATQVGHLTGAKILITGSVLQVDRNLYVVAKIIGTETSRVLGASVKGGPDEDLDTMVQELAAQVAKTISDRAGELVAKPKTEADLVAELKNVLANKKRPVLTIDVSEHHVSQATIDPAAETELTLLCKELGFNVIDPEDQARKKADVVITGEGFSEFAARHGNLVSVKARLELKVVDAATGGVLAVDRETAIQVDLSEQIAAKSALQRAAFELAERVIPKLVP